MRNASRAPLFAFVGMLLASAFAVALADVPAAAPPLRPPIVVPHAGVTPVPPFMVPHPSNAPATLAPMPSMPPLPAGVPNMRGAQRTIVARIPRSRFAPLPPRTRANTFTARDVLSGRRHPLSATGDTVNLTPFGCATNGGGNYALGNPCFAYWYTTFGNNSINTGDTLEDVYLDPPDPTTFNAGATYTITSAQGNCGQDDCGNFLDFNEDGNWVLGTYDVTANAWVDVAYIQVGTTNTLQTFSDQYDTVPSDSFAGGSTVYFSTSGLQGADDYAYYVESTSTVAQCVYVYPAPAATPPPGLCNPDTAVAQAPVGGTFTGSWTIPATEATGTYSLVLFDTSNAQRIAQIQFSVTKTGASGAISITGAAGASGTAAPSAAPAAPTPAAIFAFDNTNENSDSGFTASVTGLTKNHTYREVISDPDGMVQYNTDVTTAGTTASIPWTFSNTQSPNNYTGDEYTLTLYDTAGLKATAGATPNPNDVAASKAFQIVGYNVLTEFTNPVGTSLTLTGSAVVSGLQFDNDGGSTYFNNQNADPIARIAFTTGKVGVTMTLGSGSTSCGANCQQQTIVDTNGVNWTFTVNTTGGGANAGSTLIAVPVTAGQSLAVGATVTLPNITWNAPPGNSNCSNGCDGTTTVLPVDGADWSSSSETTATNYVNFSNGNVTSWTSTGHMYFIGYATRFFNGTLNLGPDIHGFTPRSESISSTIMQDTYAYNQPTTAANGNYVDVYDLHVANTSSGSGTAAISEIGFIYPAALGGGNTYVYIDNNISPTDWAFVTCPNGEPATMLCIQIGGSNNGIAVGSSEDIYIDVIPAPHSSFAYTDFALTVLQTGTGGGAKSNVFSIAPDGSNTVFVGTTNPETIDSTATAAYALDNTKMTGSFAPSSVGSPSNDNVTVAFTNDAGSGDFPDEIDAVAVDIPSTYVWSNPTVSAPSAGWSYLGSQTSGANTRYYFGECSAQEPASGTGSWNPATGDSMPSCGTALEQPYSLQAGATFNASGTLTIPGGVTGPIDGTIWVHGANADGWDGPSGIPIALNISATGATAGFSAIYQYGGAVVPITAPNNPFVGADSDPTYGNDYQYTVTNTGASAGTCAGGIPCNSITKVTVTIPYKDINNVSGVDSTGIDWQVTPTGAPAATVKIVGSQGSGTTCTATVTNPLPLGAPTTTGSIVVNGGASCYIAPGDQMVITFSAQAPYMVNHTFQFPTKFSVLTGGGTTNNVAALQAWTGAQPVDLDVTVVADASLVIVVDPGTGPGTHPSHPSPTCPVCSFGADEINFGAIANNASVTGSDLATVSVYTDVGNPAGWALYVSTNNNPTNSTGAPTNELLTEVDSSTSSTGMSLNFDATSYTVIPTSGTGIEDANAPTTVSATREPYNIVQSYKISIGTEAITPETSVVTYTWVEN